MKNRSIVRDTFWIYIASIFAGILGYLLRILYARSLSVADYGTFYAIYAFFSLLGLLRDLGLGEATVFHGIKYFVKKRYSSMRAVLFYNQAIQTGMGILLAFILFLLRGQIVSFFFRGNPNAELMFTVMLILFVAITVFASYTTFPRIFGNYLLSGIGSSINMFTILTTSFVLFQLYPSSPLVPCLAYIFGYSVLSGIYAWIIARKHPYVKGKPSLRKNIVRDMFLYGLPVLVTSIGIIIFSTTDTLLLSILKNPIEVARYQVAKPLMTIITSFIGPLSLVLFPIIAHAWHKKRVEDAKRYMGLGLVFILLITIPIAILLAVFPSQVVTLLFGEKYASAAPILSILAVSGIAMGIFSVLMQVFVGFGMVKERAKIFYTGAITNIIIDLALIPILGGVGAAIGTLISLIVITIISLLLIHKRIGIPSFTIFRGIPIIISGILATIPLIFIRILHISLYLKLILGGVVFISLYIALVLLFRAIRISEVIFIAKQISHGTPLEKGIDKLSDLWRVK
ncbi:flippase [Candidatus Woesearchaeota archaeon]|nr:flippase [Candidatus Woesearchaeota archaeon]